MIGENTGLFSYYLVMSLHFVFERYTIIYFHHSFLQHEIIEAVDVMHVLEIIMNFNVLIFLYL